jgi:hypothetical protein
MFSKSLMLMSFLSAMCAAPIAEAQFGPRTPIVIPTIRQDEQPTFQFNGSNAPGSNLPPPLPEVHSYAMPATPPAVKPHYVYDWQREAIEGSSSSEANKRPSHERHCEANKEPEEPCVHIVTDQSKVSQSQENAESTKALATTEKSGKIPFWWCLIVGVAAFLVAKVWDELI